MKFQDCYQLHNTDINSDSLSAVLMVGDFDFKTIVTHGSEPMGKERIITKAKDNIILEIDGQAALDTASESFGEAITPDNMVQAILCLGVGFKVEESDGFLSPFVLRAMLDIDFENKAIIIPTAVEDGTEVHIMRRDPASVITSATRGAETVKASVEAIPAVPKLVVQFDCAGRGKHMIGSEVGEAMSKVQGGFDAAVPWMGTFAFGEISPIHGKNFFHNYTGTMAVFY